MARASHASGDSRVATLDAHGESSLNGSRKLCCSCGVDVTHKKRMKDSSGTYWCYECGVADTRNKREREGTACPDCHVKFAPSQLTDFDGTKLCVACYAKRKMSVKRTANRIAAVAAHDKKTAENRKIILGFLGALGLVGGVIAMAMFVL
jgi:hypothetical protein